MSRPYRVAVPPGVGDVYWCLTKLKALRERVGAAAVELCVQKAGPGRSTDWARMVDFVETSSFFPFKPSAEVLATGYSEQLVGVNAVLWPNAIVDRGRPLAEWLPDLALDLDFPVTTEDMGRSRVVVYASSVAINRAWVPKFGPKYWVTLIRALTVKFGQVTLVGAAWDGQWTQQLRKQPGLPPFEDLTAKTSLPQVADILKHARVVVGVISGMTILANHFRTPCIAFYPQAHHPDFPRTWVAPDAPYLPLCSSKVMPPADVAARAAELARKD